MDLSLTGFINRSTPQVQEQIRSDRSFSNLPAVMLAKKGPDSTLDSPDMVAETKWDGTRVLIVKRDDEVRIFVARGNHTEYTHRYPLLIADAKKLKCTDCTLDGEFVFHDGRGHDVFLGIAARDTTIGSKKYKYVAFDILEKDGRNIQDLPLEKRKKILDDVVPDRLTIIKESKIVKTNIRAFFNRQVAANKEGVVLKRKGSPYVGSATSRNNDWIKIKKKQTWDVIAKGGTEGTGARQPFFGAIKCYLPKNGRMKYVGDVGSGLTNAELRRLTPKIRREEEFVIEVTFLEWTPDGKMRMPVFLRVRTDKTPNEVRASHD